MGKGDRATRASARPRKSKRLHENAVKNPLSYARFFELNGDDDGRKQERKNNKKRKYKRRASMPTETHPAETPDDNCHLLTIPPELRNHIYNLTVVEQDAIEVTGKRPAGGQPALLRTCRQIRNEASPIFYGNNTFTVTIRNFRGHITGPFQRQYLACMPRQDNICFVRIGVRNYHNLMLWLKAYHEGKAPMLPIAGQEGQPPQFEFFGDEVFNSAVASTLSMPNEPWVEVREALRNIYRDLTPTTSSWMTSVHRVLGCPW